MSALTHFGCLDELTQVIYQGVYRFVVLSSVTDAEWILHMGLVDSQGRWWQGRWTEDNVLGILGTKASGELFESFSERLKDAFVRGELYIGNWKPDKDVDINLTFNPTSKESVQLLLREIDPSEAAAYATSIFLEIALQAQTRECRLHPSAYATNTAASISKPAQPVTSTSEKGTADVAVEERSTTSSRSNKARDTDKGQRTLVAKPIPNKKARKYAAIEFESDEE
ncbi:hypothetical protein AX15_004225 [Amanita polypyramis BW_CC]|nr:hypothetical protein AX15_004225 [Amanita polypyramis BW_CC]